MSVSVSVVVVKWLFWRLYMDEAGDVTTVTTYQHKHVP